MWVLFGVFALECLHGVGLCPFSSISGIRVARSIIVPKKYEKIWKKETTCTNPIRKGRGRGRRGDVD